MKKAIVTGGAGFIGSHMVELLLNQGFTVISIDNFSNGQVENVKLFENNPSFHFHNIDLANEFDSSLFSGVDYVFHMAALADIVPSIENPIKYHLANVTGTIRVLEACRKYGVKKLVYSASLSQKLHNKPLTIVGDGSQTRDFTYVTDVTHANLLAAESDLNGEIINIGTSRPQTINYLAKLIG